jgi:antitoxin (DNA-binding transcriptional repressor) of toxin-antitoxin stability system
MISYLGIGFSRQAVVNYNIPDLFHLVRFAKWQAYNGFMGKHVIRISEAEAAATSVASLLARVRAGAEIVIENDTRPVAILHATEPVRRTISECIALLPEDSTATIDPDFSKDVANAIESHRAPLDPPAWD